MIQHLHAYEIIVYHNNKIRNDLAENQRGNTQWWGVPWTDFVLLFLFSYSFDRDGEKKKQFIFYHSYWVNILSIGCLINEYCHNQIGVK